MARERARAEREANERRERRNRFFIQGGLIVGLLAIVAVVVLVVTGAPPSSQTEDGPRNMLSDGILFTGEAGEVTPLETPAIAAGGEPVETDYPDDGIAHIISYTDFSCPACRGFEAANADYIEQLVESGEATYEVHPIAILDRFFQNTRYSSRSANVGACVANYAPEQFLDVSEALFANQPSEGTTGLTNDQLIEVVAAAGVTDDEVAMCIAEEEFRPWVEAATARATGTPLPGTDGIVLRGTPTLLVNGQLFDPTAYPSFPDFVESVVEG